MMFILTWFNFHENIGMGMYRELSLLSASLVMNALKQINNHEILDHLSFSELASST